MITAEEVKALLAGATEGPWKAFPKPKYDEWHVSLPISGSAMRLGLFSDGLPSAHPEADAKLIAAVHHIAAAFIAQAARLEQLETTLVLAREGLGHVPFMTLSNQDYDAYTTICKQIDAVLQEAG